MTPVASRISAVLLVLSAAACATPPPAPRTTDLWTDGATGMTFLRVESGTFTMGSPAEEPGREAQEQPHTVRITRPYWLGRNEVTQREWQAVMGSNPSWFRDRADNYPVENVTWHEVNAFIARLNEQTPGARFRLPTEAEWEYACRAGTRSSYATGSTLTHADANFARSPDTAARGDEETTATGSFPPNAWGFHDMHGNVWEWTADQHCPYPTGEASDPVGACAAPLKVIRGGSFYFGADSARCALRYTHRPQDRGFSLGFRVARD
jgi:sulfatase modifying factor 1